jgi:hypothetical protein
MRNLFLLPLVLTLFSCGSNSDYVNVSVITPFGMNKKFHNLSKEILNLSGTQSLLAPNYCLQGQVMAGTNEEAGNNRVFTKKIKLLTDANVDCSALNTGECIQANSFIPEPITIQVKKGIEVDIGILGVLYNPFDALPADNICDTLTGTNPPASGSTAINGHKVVNISDPSTTTLPIWATYTYPAAAPSAPFACDGAAECGKNFLRIKVVKAGCTSIKLVRAYYFRDVNTKDAIRHELYSSSTANNGTDTYSYYIPSFFPTELTFYDENGNQTTKTITDENWSYSPQTNCSINLHSMNNPDQSS